MSIYTIVTIDKYKGIKNNQDTRHCLPSCLTFLSLVNALIFTIAASNGCSSIEPCIGSLKSWIEQKVQRMHACMHAWSLALCMREC